jgi:membrane-bound lytic murein transglycosylase B
MRLNVLTLALFLGACATTNTPEAAAKPSPISPEDGNFSKFIENFRTQALAAGISPQVYDAAMMGAHRIPRVAEHNLNQPEFIKPVWAYLDGAVSDGRIVKGRNLIADHDEMLAGLEARFGVPKEVLVAIWAIETDYGRGMGSYNIFSALGTLAYDGPRQDYARQQLIAALKMMEQQQFAAADMTASWAGAFGQTQFVPTTFLAKGVDGDGDGKVDMWHSPADALASTANVLAGAGWQPGQPWGYEVKLPAGFAYEDADLDIVQPVEIWRQRGVTTIAGNALTGGDAASIYLPAGANGPAFMIFANFKAVLKYNNAASYAMAVSLLADRIKGLPGVVTAWPRGEKTLNRAERLTLQDSLSRLGFDIGKIDGLIGARTRAAIRGFQKRNALPADGYATFDLLARIATAAKDKPAVSATAESAHP